MTDVKRPRSSSRKKGRPSNLRLLWDSLRGNRWRAGIVGVTSLLEGVAEAAILALFASIAIGLVGDRSEAVFVAGSISLSTLTAQVTLLALVFFRFALSSGGSYVMAEVERSVVYALRIRVLNAYSSATWQAHTATAEGAFQQILIDLPNKAGGSISSLLKNFFQVVSLLAMISIAALASPLITFGLLALILGISMFFVPLRRSIKSKASSVLQRQRSLSSSAAEVSRMKTELHAFGVVEDAIAPITGAVLIESYVARRLSFIKGMVVPIYTLGSYLAVGVGLIILSQLEGETITSAGPVLLIVLRSLSNGQSFQTIGVLWASFVPVLTSLEIEVHRLQEGARNFGDYQIELFESVELDGISVKYPASGGSVLHDLSIRFSRGERIGIVGPSGGGKTTLVRAVLGLVSLDAGTIRVNGHEVSHVSERSWKRFVAFVPQQTQLLNASVRENVTFFRPGFSDEDVWYALEVANLSEVIRRMPEGLEASVGPAGWSMSGGEQQRLAIARAVLSRPDVLVMDEPSASLDQNAEQGVAAAISQIPDNVCLVIVSHRAGILAVCSRLVVVDDGRIAVDGERNEVSAASGFARFLVSGIES